MKMQKQYTDVIDYRALLMQNIVTGCATGINRALAQLAGQCKDTSQVIMHDWWLGVVAARFGRAVYLDESTMLYRQHGGNSVGAKNAGSVKDSLQTFSHINRLRADNRGQKAAGGRLSADLWRAAGAGGTAVLSRFSPEAERSGLLLAPPQTAPSIFSPGRYDAAGLRSQK